MGLHGEGVVEVSVQLAHRNLGVSQTHAGRLITDFLSAGLAHHPLTALAFNTVGDVRATSSVFRRAPGEEEFSCAGGGNEVTWGRRES